ncbi:creatininase family protein [Janthinobacterium sp. SUN118]|uniref:creatininase family protein n=1 Tax=Janthinobacterium sp. SUN118 TaxID=3004100 RepID=UPI0025AF9D9E|nr:creatininase family protein [Janthinobacterium sp. SUN118]MDN2712235.1 creatininase family protein [Janthinobacterium sp. SUN118]
MTLQFPLPNVSLAPRAPSTLRISRKPLVSLFALTFSCLLAAAPAMAAAPAGDKVMLEELTSTELRSRIDHGATTVLIPIGGVEQSGPYIALGKHNVRAGLLARQIAQKLGNTIVAPVVSYVPEGAISPPAGHMRHAGTLSIPPAAFEAVLEGAAASLRQHGFRDIIFLGDHGGYQKNEQNVANKLNRAWGKTAGANAARAYALLDYYDITQTAYIAELQKRGHSSAEIGLHAGLADAALMLATDPSLVRSEAMAHGPKPGVADGVRGDATRATAELGQIGVKLQVDTSVAAIRQLLQRNK